jgi:triphosphoribosyl-dephospho-CoA synthetase
MDDKEAVIALANRLSAEAARFVSERGDLTADQILDAFAIVSASAISQNAAPDERKDYATLVFQNKIMLALKAMEDVEKAQKGPSVSPP